MLTQNINYQPLYNSLPIQFHPTGVNGEILNAAYNILIDMGIRHSKVFYVRADIYFPDNGLQYPHGNDIFEAFIADFAKALKRKEIDVSYLWVREQDTSINHHYNLCLFLNGNAAQHPQGVLEIAERIWAHKVAVNSDNNNGLIHYCTADAYGNPIDNGIILERYSPEEHDSFCRIIYSASYLAKTYSKGYVRTGVRQFNHSRIHNKPSVPPENSSNYYSYGQQIPI